MRIILLLMVSLIAVGSQAQDEDFKRFQEDFQKKHDSKNVMTKSEIDFKSMLPGTSSYLMAPQALAELYITTSGQRIRNLQQDMMPCIVPFMNQFNMPVVKPDMNSVIAMPNPGVKNQEL